MNGRGYDPRLGRFLSVDPFIQSPTNTQSINPYTYIFNNPLSGTDPTGYKSQSIDCNTDPEGCRDFMDDLKKKKKKQTDVSSGEQNSGTVEGLITKTMSAFKEGVSKAKINISDSANLTNDLNHGASRDSSGEKILNFDYEKLKPTDKEYELVKNGKLSEMWKGRCSNGDPIGCVGFATWGTVDEIRDYYGDNKLEAEYWIGVGATVQFNATTGLLQGNEFMQSEMGRTYLPHFTKELGKKIALAHLRATERDFKNTPYFLSASQITEYHHRVFDAHNVSRKWYGGSYMTGKHEGILTPTYCRPTCDIE